MTEAGCAIRKPSTGGRREASSGGTVAGPTTPGRRFVALVWILAALAGVALVLLIGRPAAAAISTVQEQDRGYAQYGNWMFTEDPGVSGGWESTTRTPGATATLRFKGTSVAWKTIKYEGGGITDVFLDGRKAASFDGYSSSLRYDVTGFSRKGLTSGKHTLKLVVTGEKHAGTSGDIFTIVDRFLVGNITIQEPSRKIAYDGWSAAASPSASGGAYRQSRSRTSGASCGLFSGPEIDLITASGPTRGMARVRVQDLSTEAWVQDFQVDLNSPRVEWQHPVPVTGLDQNRTYRLEATSADGKPVVFDGCSGNLQGRLN